MFLRRHEPILLTEEGIEGLCTSLNRPVVSVEGHSVGPASSAILLCRDSEGDRSLVVALRFEESGSVVLFGFDGALGSSDQAMDTGLAFAEGMGFLFDDDVLAGGAASARRNALEFWCQLTGEEVPEQGPAELRPEGEALLLDDEVDAPGGGRRPPSSTLSKFRMESDAGPGPAGPSELLDDEDGTAAQLGRIPIVRRRRSDSEPESAPLLTRLLALF